MAVNGRSTHWLNDWSTLGVLAVIDEQPTVDAIAPKKGKWRVVSKQADSFTAYRCSECNGLIYGQTDFCPRCGADMRGEANE